MRFQDAAPDARHIVYANIQADPLVAETAALLAEATHGERVMARAVMNGERSDPETWRAMFPTVFGAPAPADVRDRAERILTACLDVADRGEATRSQFRGAIVEELTERILRRRTPDVRRERRILFDGVRAEIHPYDVSVEREASAEVYDCKWGARGINADVLDQLDDARRHAAAEDAALIAAIVVFDARRSCLVRLARQTVKREGIGLVSIETLDRLAGASAKARP